ncbi:MAG TPA: hypothetical protein VKU87_01305 [Thermomicrobiaceae bacterium]|nr:hypothetical protein [Thermomicrobiaceae bacterium]
MILSLSKDYERITTGPRRGHEYYRGRRSQILGVMVEGGEVIESRTVASSVR